MPEQDATCLSTEGLPFFDREGSPISAAEHAKLRGKPHYRFVADNKVEFNGDRYHVTTVWLGDCYASIWMTPPKKPRIYGTLLRGLGDGHGLQFRWTTLRDAEDGHRKIVDALRIGDMEVIKLLTDQFGC